MPILNLAQIASASQAVAGAVARTSSSRTEGKSYDDWDDWLDTDEHADSDADDG